MIVLLLIGATGEIALGQSLDWAKRAGGPNFQQGKAIAVDSAGNSYVTGWFTGSATFGPGEANEITLTSSGSDAFVAKYNNSGALLWVRQASGPETRGDAISVDGNGNSYVTGVFRFFADFQGTPPPGNPHTLNEFASGVSDMFVAKYDSNGNFVWAKQAGPDLIPGIIDVGKHGRGISADSAGNSYITGHFGTELGEAAVFVAKYDTDGTRLWAKYASHGGIISSGASGSAISIDGAGNSYITGGFFGPITFGLGALNETILTSATASINDMFVAKYDSSGTFLRARRVGATGFDEGEGISADAIGNSYLTGVFGGGASVTFGAGEPNETTLMGVSGLDIFVAKYDTNGMLVWAKEASGPGNDEGLAISVDSTGNCHVTGYFTIYVTFGPGEPNETTLTNAVPTFGGPSDIFVAKYNGSGALLWAKQASGPRIEAGHGIGADSAGNSYVTGYYGDVSGAGDPTSVIFGAGETNETTLTTAPGSGTEIFVAKYKNDSAPPSDVVSKINAVVVTISNSDLIPSGIKTSLIVKLQAAMAALQTGDVVVACSKLQDFLNEMKAQRGKKIPVGLADSLTGIVSAIKSSLGCT